MELVLVIMIICLYCCFDNYITYKQNKATVEKNFIDDMTNKGYEQTIKDGKTIWVKINGNSKIS